VKTDRVTQTTPQWVYTGEGQLRLELLDGEDDVDERIIRSKSTPKV
jgi:hypothetical protein